jgi:hypothetical protein
MRHGIGESRAPRPRRTTCDQIHSLLGIGVFAGLAWLACHFRHDLAGHIGLGFLTTLIIAGVQKLTVGDEWDDIDLVFCQWNGRPLDLAATGRSGRTSLKATGLPHHRVHAMRHSAATIMLHKGVGSDAGRRGTVVNQDQLAWWPLGWQLATKNMDLATGEFPQVRL